MSNPENLARYVPHVSQADAGHGDAIHIRGACPHGDFFGVGSFHVDAENLKMRWDSRASIHYRGSLQIFDHGDHSEVSIHLEFDPGMERSTNSEFGHLIKEHPGTIQGNLEEALARIKSICESSLTPA
ncbi:MAG TPA: hypothetical protein VHE55_18610 [Fimbriimonadaceae bacterium]|nr:hypothetical protein [Fimbriimonadaceae bacterium]